jgi:tetratricopeptide (TPR) repeat protein
MNDTSKSRINILKQYISEDPTDSFSQYALALEYAKAGSNDEAISVLSELLKGDSNYLPAYYQIGKLYEQTHSIDRAKTAYEKGIVVAQQQKNTKTLNELRSALDSLED